MNQFYIQPAIVTEHIATFVNHRHENVMADVEEPLLSDTPPQRKRDIVRKNLGACQGIEAPPTSVSQHRGLVWSACHIPVRTAFPCCPLLPIWLRNGHMPLGTLSTPGGLDPSSTTSQTFGRLVLILVVLIFILVQALAWKGYVNLNWHQIGRAFKQSLDLDNDGRLGMGDLKQGAKQIWNVVGGYGIPSIAAVALGFYVGIS